jgi:hypothetical protein
MNNKEKEELRVLEFINFEVPHILKPKDIERMEYLKRLKGNQQF